MSVRERVRQAKFRTASQEAMVSLLVAAAHLRARLEEVCGGAGVTTDQYNVLRILRGAHPEGHPRYEIAARMMDRAPDVTRLLDRLQRRGLVRRARAGSDRRLSVARITDKGLALLERTDAAIEAVHAAYAAELSPEDLARLLQLCDRLIPREGSAG